MAEPQFASSSLHPEIVSLAGPLPHAAKGDPAGAAAAVLERPLAWLRRELRRERARGRCGHWTYDLARHLALLQDVRRAEGHPGSPRGVEAPSKAGTKRRGGRLQIGRGGECARGRGGETASRTGCYTPTFCVSA